MVTASRAGAERGCGLLWTILFATVGAIVLQSLAARVGIVQRQGLGEAIRDALSGTRWFRPMLLLVVCALGVGNSAYQAGNLAGAATGIQQATGLDPKLSILLLAVVATAGAAATPLLIRIIKPVVKKIWAKIQKKLGKEVKRPSLAEVRTNKYREKKGLPPLKKK